MRQGIVARFVIAISVPALTGAAVGQVACSQCWSEADRTLVPYGGHEDQVGAER